MKPPINSHGWVVICNDDGDPLRLERVLLTGERQICRAIAPHIRILTERIPHHLPLHLPNYDA